MALRRAFVYARYISRQSHRPIASQRVFPTLARSHSTYTQKNSNTPASLDDVKTFLESESIWSVESLLPPQKTPDAPPAPNAPKITKQQLHHLLRLSALPLPKTQEEEDKMLDTLSDQLHFVGEIQQVDTTGVEPLRAIRDETAAAETEQTITMETLKDALAKEKVIGKHYKRIQRDTTPVDASDVENWDVLGSAERKQGKYFVVESERPPE